MSGPAYKFVPLLRPGMAYGQTAPAITPEVLLYYSDCISCCDDYWVSGVLEDAAYEVERLSSELEDAKADIATLIAKESGNAR